MCGADGTLEQRPLFGECFGFGLVGSVAFSDDVVCPRIKPTLGVAFSLIKLADALPNVLAYLVD